MNKITFSCLLLLCCLLFCACGARNAQTILDCEELLNAVKDEILPTEGYSEYSSRDASYLLDLSGADDHCLAYSSSSDDMGEIGILRAPDSDTAKRLLDEVNDHLDDLREDKTEFVKRYMPNELKKLESASAKRYGSYVAYAVLDTEAADRFFDSVSRRLK